MDKNSIWKWIILLALVCWSVVLVTPFNKKVSLGLDLKGGTSYVVELDETEIPAETRGDAKQRAVEIIRSRVDSMGVAEPVIYPETGNNRIVIQIPGQKAEDRERTRKNIQSAAFLEFRLVHPKNEELVKELFTARKVFEGYEMVEIDRALPGQPFGKFWKFKGEPEQDMQKELARRARLRMFEAPAGYELLLMKETVNNQELFQPHFVKKNRELSGENLKSAGVNYQQMNQPVVELKFDAKGAKKFAAVTADHAPGGAKNTSLDGRHFLGIVLDGNLYSAPFIKQAIHGGEAIIEGSFSVKEAQDLALILRAGALPAPVRIIEERTVDPTLGADSIISGKRAAIFSFVSVALFMLAYYRMAGLVANFALILNIILLPLGMMLVAGFFSLLDSSGLTTGRAIALPTLTLPGIAGIALTIGMAVDANVLIYERIREEQKTGKRFVSAIAAGYEKAFTTIFDSNITTLLAAGIMFWQGSGPIKGFAITLSAGIVVSMYTAIVVTRMIFNVLAEKTGITQIKMMQFVKDNAAFDFMGKRKFVAVLSVALLIASVAVLVAKGNKNFNVDFTGGQAMTLGYAQEVPAQELRSALATAGVKDPTIQYQRELAGAKDDPASNTLEIKVATPEEGAQVREVLTTQFAAAQFRVLQEDTVGPQVGKELQRRGLMAIVAALIGMVLYITIRFEFAFAAGGILAVAHDVIIAIGIFCLLGRQISMPIIAALLTIAGYSINDTIVVFDRIREQLKLHRGRSYVEVANMSINQTLSRTILTSGTTLLSVIMIMLFGGGAIFDFALALFIGIMIGTYSSIYIATPIALLFHPDKIKAEAEKAV